MLTLVPASNNSFTFIVSCFMNVIAIRVRLDFFHAVTLCHLPGATEMPLLDSQRKSKPPCKPAQDKMRTLRSIAVDCG